MALAPPVDSDDDVQHLLQNNHHLNIISDFAITLLDLSATDDVLWHAAKEVAGRMGFDDCVIYLWDAGHELLLQRQAFGHKTVAPEAIVNPLTFKLGEGVVGRAAQTRKAVIINDLALIENNGLEVQVAGSELAIPIIHHNELIGVIGSEHGLKNFYNAERITLLTAVAAMLAVKLAKTKQMTQLENSIVQWEYAEKLQKALFQIATLSYGDSEDGGIYEKLHGLISPLIYAKSFFLATYTERAERIEYPYFFDEVDGRSEAFAAADARHMDSLAAYVLFNNTTLLLNYDDIVSGALQGQYRIYGAIPQSWLGVPFDIGATLKAVLVVQSYSKVIRYTDKDRELLTFVAHHICDRLKRNIDLDERKRAEQELALWNEDLEERVLRRTKELKFANFALENARNDIALLSEMGRDITASLDMASIFDMLYERIRLLMDCETFGIGLYQSQMQIIEFNMAIQAGKRFQPYTRSMLDKNQLAVWCIDHAQAIFINDIELECANYLGTAASVDLSCGRFEDGSDSIRGRSCLYVPLLVKERVLGLLSVQSSRKNAYLKQHLDMLQTLASYAAIAIDNAHTHEHLSAAHNALQCAHSDLKSAQDQLLQQEKMASLGTLTAGVAHEINNPTNFCHVAAQNLDVDLQKFEIYLHDLVETDEAPELTMTFTKRFMQLRDHVATVLNGTTRIKAIVRDLRSFTRMDAVEKQTVNVSDNLQSTLNLVRSTYQDRIDFDVELAADVHLSCYPAQLNQVFMNLIVNACQAILSKKEVSAGAEKGRVRLRCERRTEAIVVEVEDNGTGMSAAIQARILEPFFTTKAIGEGTGLGLSISYGILRKHHGELQIRSTPGEGSCFTVLLPLNHRAPPEATELGNA